MDRDILLACRDASLGYEHRALLEHLTFTVRAGDYLCVAVSYTHLTLPTTMPV